MSRQDLNLLFTLHAVLTDGSVVKAAQRLHLSPSAMSRALSRLRETVGDPLLVKAGRGLVPTPRAAALREPVDRLLHEAQAILRPVSVPDLKTISRTFSVRTSEGFVETFGADIVARVIEAAPGIRLQFLSRQTRDGAGLRDGTVDLETGVVDQTTSPELRQWPLFEDRLVGVVRTGHAWCRTRVTATRYASAAHIGVARRTVDKGWIEAALATLGLKRTTVTSVSGFATALSLARASDLVATVPERHTAALRTGMHTFDLPFTLPTLTVSMLWHPRMHADPVHRWLRERIHGIASARTPVIASRSGSPRSRSRSGRGTRG